jgi:hypothetical protein
MIGERDARKETIEMPEPTGTPGATPGAGTDGGTPSTGTPGATPGTEAAAVSAPLTFDQWFPSQDKAIQDLVQGRLQALEGTLRAQKGERENLTKQIKDLAAKAEKGSETQKALEDVSAKLDAETRRADFFEDAAKPDIGCSNPRLAYLAAQQAGAIDQKGRINWDVLKQQFPELFKPKSPPPASAGAGTSNPPAAKNSMNDYIRHAAGRT